MTRTPTAIDADLRAAKELAASRGWELIRQHLKDEVYKLSVTKSRNVHATQRQSDMSDGAISATDGFLHLADTMVVRLEGEKAMLAAAADTPEGATNA